MFDADNVVDKDFLHYINIEYSKGYKIITSYRMPKNYNSSWVAAISGLMYIRESVFVNRPKKALNISCSISGTGFLVDSNILKDGWKYHLLTEDIQLSSDLVSKGQKIGYAKDAITYDEQPTDLKTFFRQRTRWAKGFLQVFRKYSGKLFLKSFTSISAFDIFSFIFPTSLIFILSFLVNLSFAIFGYSTSNIALGNYAIINLTIGISLTLLTPFVFGLITTLTEFKRIKASFIKKIWYSILFPIAFFIYLAAFLTALLKKKVVWKPIKHSDTKDIVQM
ncbi:hypothetical protein MBVG596_1132 [Mycoplasmopsis bovigenitalium]|uniref:glycosyltransferase family 2 protein n=1 Tax=Mycoplasmopsis bovigenitalium TaxID=2112 RepID=UPI00090AD43E|nr:glycosyltransferase [Mycoplasmopsis bovigenitalium]BAW18587.1 hypothetical protein MBVG596_1132 [Mycoplasmopsis bovigenitalium]